MKPFRSCGAVVVTLMGCSPSPRSVPPEPPGVPVAPPVAIDAEAPDAYVPDAAVPVDAGVAAIEIPDADSFDCAEACSVYGGCWEQVNKGQEFRGGRDCGIMCEAMSPAAARAWAARVTKALRANRCRRVVEE